MVVFCEQNRSVIEAKETKHINFKCQVCTVCTMKESKHSRIALLREVIGLLRSAAYWFRMRQLALAEINSRGFMADYHIRSPIEKTEPARLFSLADESLATRTGFLKKARGVCEKSGLPNQEIQELRRRIDVPKNCLPTRATLLLYLQGPKSRTLAQKELLQAIRTANSDREADKLFRYWEKLSSMPRKPYIPLKPVRNYAQKIKPTQSFRRPAR